MRNLSIAAFISSGMLAIALPACQFITGTYSENSSINLPGQTRQCLVAQVVRSSGLTLQDCESVTEYTCVAVQYSPLLESGQSQKEECFETQDSQKWCIALPKSISNSSGLKNSAGFPAEAFAEGGELNSTSVECKIPKLGYSDSIPIFEASTLDEAFGKARDFCRDQALAPELQTGSAQ